MDAQAKARLREELIRLLEKDLHSAERAQEAAREGATHEEARPENDKDTRALEASYLARGQAMRVEELRAAVAETKAMAAVGLSRRAALGSVVTAEEDGTTATFFLAPHGGGTKLAEGSVLVVTPQSPLGRALLGKEAGDDCEVALAGRTRELTIVNIA